VRGVLDRRGFRRPGQAVGRKLRIQQLEQLELDLKAGKKIEAGI
jgi:hypothetical protein